MNQTNIRHYNGSILAFSIVGVMAMYFIFAPAINLLYYNVDAFRYVYGGFGQSCKSDDGFEFYVTFGPSLEGVFDLFVYKFCYSLERMKTIRLISIILMGCATGLFAEWLYRLGLTVWSAFFAAGCLFLLPHLYEDTVLVGALSLPIALIFAQLGYRCLYLLNISNSKKQMLAASLLMLALLTYPAMAFFFVTLILTKFLFSNFSDWMRLRNELFQEMLLFCMVCAVYFVLAYLVMRFHPGNTQGWMMIALIASGILIRLNYRVFFQYLSRLPSLTNLAKSGQIVLTLFMLMVLSSGFFLTIPSAESPIMLRFLFAPLAAGFMLILWCMRQWDSILPTYMQKRLISGIIISFFLIESYEAGVHTFVSALAVEQYMHVVVQKVNNYLTRGNKLQRVHFILAEQEYPYTKFFMTRAILNMLGQENSEIKWCSLPRGFNGKEEDYQSAALTCIREKSNNVIAVTYSYAHTLFSKTNNTLIIDMKNITSDKFRKQNLQKYFDLTG